MKSDFNPIEPLDLGVRRGLPVEKADFIVRVSRYKILHTNPWLETKRISLQSDFLDYGSTMRLPGPDGDEWVLDFIEIVEKEIEDE